MKTFEQWLNEKGLRTGIGLYPPSYATFQYPPLYFTPMSGGAANMLTRIHSDEHPELFKPEFRKKVKLKDSLKKYKKK